MNKELLDELKGIRDRLSSVISKLQGTPSPADRTYTREEVRQTLAELAGNGHRDEVRELIKKYGAESLGTLDPSNYAAIMADAEAIDHE